MLKSMKKTYKSSWNSLRSHPIPQWFQDAKFGIYTHWGVYGVPGFGPNGSWYPYFMYQPGTKQYEHHLKTYGGPEQFGYKDFIPEFTGEKFDADEWAEIFKGAGARFAGPVGEHHDGFCMWDSAYTKWKATNMGPKRDVVGELAKAIRKQDMRFMVALHHAENWWFFPHENPNYDTSNPDFAGLYGEAHEHIGEPYVSTDPEDTWPHEFFSQFEKSKPSQSFLELWKNKTREVIDAYRPDLLWFDFGLRGIQEHYKRDVLAHYYNQAAAWDKEVLVTYKLHDLVPGSGMIDLELGRFADLTYQMWLTDTTVDDGQGWGYLHNQKYKDVSTLVHYLVDNISKNGYLLLNIGPKPNGEIPSEAKTILAGIGKWLEINGEAVYSTTPWMTFGEGPAAMDNPRRTPGVYGEGSQLNHSAKDIRFTTKDETLYAICLGWPTEQVIIKSCRGLYLSEIKSVSMLGVDQKLAWTLTGDGLVITPPSEKPCDHAFVFKIERKQPFG
jgi:alpha-L-fucosidase